MADEIYVKHNYCNGTDLLPNKLENGNLYFVRDDGVYFDLYNERRKIGPVINDRDSTFTDVDESSVPTSGVVKEAIEDSNSWQSGASQGKVLSANDNGLLQWVDPSSMNHWTITKKPDPWEHIINNANYATDYEIGMLQDLDFGEYGVHPMELVAMDTDDKADGSGKARMTWKCKDLLCESVMGDDNYGGSTWETSVVRHLCNTNIYNQINNEFLKQNIKEVTKECIKYDMDNNSEQVYSCSDKVWILSYDELERYDPYD